MFSLLGIAAYWLLKRKRPADSSPEDRQQNDEPDSTTLQRDGEQELQNGYCPCFDMPQVGVFPAGLHKTKLTLKDFRVHNLLGEGSFGEVHLACHIASRQTLALKKTDILCYQSNRTELQALEMTRDCPFIIRFLGSFHTMSHQYIAMEYASCGDLKGLINTYAPLRTGVLRYMSAEILCGLQYLHTRGIVHRDLKPGNILLGEDSCIKIADFGLAAIDASGSMLHDPVGTLAFVAPEVLLSQPYNWAVDYFSFGIILYLMATRHHPFITCKMDLDQAIICIHPRFPPQMDSDLKDVLWRLLCKYQEARRGLVRHLRSHSFFRPINWPELEAGRIIPQAGPPDRSGGIESQN